MMPRTSQIRRRGRQRRIGRRRGGPVDHGGGHPLSSEPGAGPLSAPTPHRGHVGPFPPEASCQLGWPAMLKLKALGAAFLAVASLAAVGLVITPPTPASAAESGVAAPTALCNPSPVGDAPEGTRPGASTASRPSACSTPGVTLGKVGPDAPRRRSHWGRPRPSDRRRPRASSPSMPRAQRFRHRVPVRVSPAPGLQPQHPDRSGDPEHGGAPHRRHRPGVPVHRPRHPAHRRRHRLVRPRRPVLPRHPPPRGPRHPHHHARRERAVVAGTEISPSPMAIVGPGPGRATGASSNLTSTNTAGTGSSPPPLRGTRPHRPPPATTKPPTPGPRRSSSASAAETLCVFSLGDGRHRRRRGRLVLRQ